MKLKKKSIKKRDNKTYILSQLGLICQNYNSGHMTMITL